MWPSEASLKQESNDAIVIETVDPWIKPKTQEDLEDLKQCYVVVKKIDPSIKLFDVVYKCKKCDALLPSAVLLKVHYRKLHTFRKWACDLCDLRFHHRHSLRTHKDVKHPSTNGQRNKHQCNMCALSFKLKTSLYQHYKAEHIPQHRTKLDICRDNSQNVCKVCEKTFDNRNSLRIHFDYIHQEGKRRYKCESCENSYNIKEHLKRHSKTHLDKESKPTYLFCIHCSKPFSSVQNLKSHVRLEHTSKNANISSTNAQRKRSRVKQLKSSGLRLQMYGRSNKVSCDTCGKTFKDRATYLYHVDAKHDPENGVTRRYLCDQCPRSFNIRANFAFHKSKAHEASSVQLKCDVCDKTISANCEFSSTKKLMLHKDRLHPTADVGVKKWFCDQCPDSYRFMSNLQRHQALVHSVKNFKCKICEVSLSSLDSLRSHKDYAHNSGDLDLKKHRCDECSVAFRFVTNLRRHKKSAHVAEKVHKIRRVKIEKDSSGAYPCKLCDKVLLSLTTYRVHNDYSHGHEEGKTKKIKCEKCEMSFDLRQNINRHMQSHNARQIPKKPKFKLAKSYSKRQAQRETELSCQYCGIEFFSINGVRQHEDFAHQSMNRDPNETRQYNCSLCESSFHYRSNLKRHLQKCLLTDKKSNRDNKEETTTRRSIRNLMKTETEWKDDFELEDYDIKIEID